MFAFMKNARIGVRISLAVVMKIQASAPPR